MFPPNIRNILYLLITKNIPRESKNVPSTKNGIFSYML